MSTAEGTALVRSCSHSGCKWPAAATLSFDYRQRYVRLDDLHCTGDPSSYDLCSVHAERFTPPVGWDADDRRCRNGAGRRRLGGRGAGAVPGAVEAGRGALG